MEAERKAGRFEGREGKGGQERGINVREGMGKVRKEEGREGKARIDGGKLEWGK